MVIHRRTLLKGLIAAPAIIAIERLMPVKLWVPPKEIIKPPPAFSMHTGFRGGFIALYKSDGTWLANGPLNEHGCAEFGDVPINLADSKSYYAEYHPPQPQRLEELKSATWNLSFNKA